MNSFYGNLKNNSRASFIFDKVYPTRKAMEDAVKNGTDGVFVNRYVLIAYNYSQNADYTVNNHSQYGYDTYIDHNDNYGKFEDKVFVDHRNLDIAEYGAQYDKTVWMKIYSNNEEKYIQVGALNAAAPAFELSIDAPGEENGRPHFDFYHSGDLNYSYHMPKNWDLMLNHYSAMNDSFFSEPITFTEDRPYEPNTYFYKDVDGVYKIDIASEATDDREYYLPNDPSYIYYYKDLYNSDSQATKEMQYPYVNSFGFNPTLRYYDYINNDDITFTEVPSGEEYPDHVYAVIKLTIDTYIKNTFYVKEGEEYRLTGHNDEFDPDQTYYIKTQGSFEQVTKFADEVSTDEGPIDYQVTPKYAANKFFYIKDEQYTLDSSPTKEPGRTYYRYKIDHSTSIQDDTKRLDVELPSIGNAISDVYDSIYGRPLKPNYPNGIKYIYDLKDDGVLPYPYQDYADETHTLQCSIDGKYYYLTPEEWEIEDANGEKQTPEPLYEKYDKLAHPIPVYNLANDIRPYTQQQLYNFLDIKPYNNVTPKDPVSMAWGVEELKKYISELRYLSHGEYNGDFDPMVYNGNGLQSDWAIDDPTAFGYIYNRPTVISHYVQKTSDEVVNNEDYFYARDISDTKHVPYFFEGQLGNSDNNITFDYFNYKYTEVTYSEFEYEPGAYYYQDNLTHEYIIDNSDTKTEGRSYYTRSKQKEISKIPMSKKVANGPYTYSNLEPPIYEVADITTHFKFNDEDTAELYSYTEIDAFTTEMPYQPNKYYYQDANNYVLDNSQEQQNGRTYYIRNQENIKEKPFQVLSSCQVGPNEDNPNIEVCKFNLVLNQLFEPSYVAVDSNNFHYVPNIFYYKENNVYKLDNSATQNSERTYYRKTNKGKLNKESVNKAYLGLGGKIISQLWFKENKSLSSYFETGENIDNITIERILEILNKPGFYDENIFKIVYATSRIDNTTIPLNFMDTTQTRDGKFHVYTNIRTWKTGLPIEKIWQNIPVEDIIVTEMYYDINDVNDIIGNDAPIEESVNVLQSPFISLNNTVNVLTTRTTNLEQVVGNIDLSEEEKQKAPLLSRTSNLERIVGTSLNTNSGTLAQRVPIAEEKITKLQNYVGDSSNATTATPKLDDRLAAVETYVGNPTIEQNFDGTYDAYNYNRNIGTRVKSLEQYIGVNTDQYSATAISVRLANAEMDINTLQNINTENRLNNLETYVGNTDPDNANDNSLGYRLASVEKFVGTRNNDLLGKTLAENVGTLNNNMTALMTSTIGSTTALNEYWNNYDYSLSDRIDILDDINDVYSTEDIVTITATNNTKTHNTPITIEITEEET